MKAIILIILCMVLCNAQATKKNTYTLHEIGSDFFKLYAERKDFEYFMSFYAADAVLEDIVYGNYIVSQNEIKKFLNWKNKSYKNINKNTLVVQKQVIMGNTMVTEGYFTEFSYDNKKMGPWRFIIWLEFDKTNKIIREVDWINYTPRDSFLGGEDMNKSLSH